MEKTSTLIHFPIKADPELKAFELFLEYDEKLQCCVSLYVTWGCIYYSSGLPEHLKAMHNAKQSILTFKREAA